MRASGPSKLIVGRGARPARRPRLMALTLAVAFLAAACGGVTGGGDDEGGSGSGSGGDEQPTAQGDGHLKVVLAAEPQRLDPLTETSEMLSVYAITDPLVAVNETASAITGDGLLTEWEMVDDTTWRFTVREGVEFTNGEPLDAEAVAFAIEFAAKDEASTRLSYLEQVKSVKAVEDFVVEVKTSTKDAALPERLVMVNAVPPAYYEKVGPDGFSKEPIGTGPFVLDEWVPGQRIDLSRNEDYWRGEVQSEQLTLTWAAEPSTRVAQLETGGVDIATNLAPETVENLDDLAVSVVPSTTQLFLGYDALTPPFDDLRMRQAVAHALDREAISEFVFGGQFPPNLNLFPPDWASSGGHDGEYLELDMEQARELVDEYEADEGEIEAITLHYPTGWFAGTEDAAELIAGSLEELGLKVDRSPREVGAFFEMLFAKEGTGLQLSVTEARFPHESVFMGTRFVTYGLTPYCHDNPEYDAMVEEAATLTGDERTAAYNELERLFLLEVVCFSPLVLAANISAATPEVGGYEPRPDGFHDWMPIAG